MRIQGPLPLDLFQYAMSLIQSLLMAADGAPLTLVDFDSEHLIPHTKFWPSAECIPVQPSDKAIWLSCYCIHGTKVLEVSPHPYIGT